ncbi:carbohydrate-binding protein [Spirosoma aerophilum]
MRIITFYLAVTLILVKLISTAGKFDWGSTSTLLLNPTTLSHDQVTTYTLSNTRTLTTLAAPFPIPGQIEAESFTTMNGVQTETTTDAGGGLNVTRIDNDDWMDYSVNVPVAGTYTVSFRVSNTNGNSKLELRNTAGTALCSVQPTLTGSYQTFATVTTTVTLPAGDQTLRVYAVKGAFNFNWMSFSSSAMSSLRASFVPISGRIEAETFSAMNGIQTETTTDEGGGLDVTKIDDNDWLDYNLTVPTAGAYIVAFRVSNTNGNSKIELRNAAGKALCSVQPTLTGSWQTFATVKAIINLPAGDQTLRVYAVKGAFNFNWMGITPLVFTATPGLIEAENYDASKGILTEPTTDVGGGLNVKSIDDTDWTDYCLNIPASGKYTAKFRVASMVSTGKIELRNSTGATLCSVSVPQTNGLQTWTTASVSFSLTAGNQMIRMYATKGAFNLNCFNVVSEQAPTIDFATLTDRPISPTPFDLVASSTNTTAPISFSSSNPAVVSVSNSTGAWKATAVSSGTAVITASQAPNVMYAVSASTSRTQVVLAPAPAVGKAIPGKIEAESFDAMSGIQTETTADAGGGLNVGWIDDNDWMDYKVSVATAGLYTFSFRIANGYGNGRIEVRTANGTALLGIDVPQTGGFQYWQTINATATLAAGNQTLRVYAVRGLFNFNWINVISGRLATTPSTITFNPLGDQPASTNTFDLVASSTNTVTPITFTSSNSAVVSVSNRTGSWKATPVAPGSAIITASQLGNDTYLDATPVTRTQVVSPPSALTADKKIPIDGSRWYQLNNTSNGLEGLFDGKTDAAVMTGWGKILNNFDAYYPLAEGESMSIESIKLFSGQGAIADYPMTLSIIDDQWQRIPVATFIGGQYNTWVGPYPTRQLSGDGQFKLDVPITKARYLVINAYFGYPNEIEFYGSYVAGKQPTALPFKSTQLKNMFGINAFEWDFEHPNTPTQIDETRWAAAKHFTAIRHYLDWQKLESTEGSFTFNPSFSGGWNIDAIYERAKADGKVVLASLKTMPDWMINTYPDAEKDSENVPVRYGKDFTNPASYLEQARMAFQFAARYGSNKYVDPALLSVNSRPRWNGDPINTVKIGLDLIKYVECDNERDKWWKGRKAYQTGREYAANMSAYYDGHKNTMGRGVGVKNADPNMTVVMGGLALATMGSDYVAGMIDWCKQYRGYKADGKVNLCWDVINYHFYPDDANSSQSGVSTRGVAPEISVAPAVTQKFLKLAHNAAYDMPVWITETGYDVNQGSPLHAIPIGNKTAKQTQADWILRTSLLYARLGIDKVFFYQMYSDDPTSQGQFGSQGLINTDKTPTLAATFLYQTNKLLGEYSYKQTINNDPTVDRYELNGKSAYALVVPDEKGRTATYTLNLGAGVTAAAVYTLKSDGTDMAIQTLPTTNGLITLTVTETPMFVLPSTGSGRVAETTVDDVDRSLATLRLYPNPAVDEVAISLTNGSVDNVEVRILDTGTGRVHQQHNLLKSDTALVQKISVSSLPLGLYLVEIKQGDNKEYRKMIKVQ